MLAENVLNMIRSPKTVAYIVTIPEALGVSQTERIEKELTKFGVVVQGIIVNYYLTEDTAENSSIYKNRREVQLKYLDILNEDLGDKLPMTKLRLQNYEVKGIEALRKVETELFKSD